MLRKAHEEKLTLLENKWLNFLAARNKKAYEQKEGMGWLTILQREGMINELLSIFRHYRRGKKNE
jgi:hypothetical protein